MKTKTRPSKKRPTKRRPRPEANGVAPSPPPDVLTLEQAAAFLQLPVETVRGEAAAGRLPGREVGRTWRFGRQCILDWLGTPERPKLADWYRDHPPRPWTAEVEKEVEAEIAQMHAARQTFGIGRGMQTTGETE